MRVAADAVFIETQAFRVDVEELFLSFPILTIAAHSFAELTAVQFAVARIANPIKDAISFRRQFLSQTLFEIMGDTTRQPEHVDEGFRGAAIFCAL